MNRSFANSLEDLLKSECEPYGYSYHWAWDNGEEVCNVEVYLDDTIKYLKFRREKGVLMLNTNIENDTWEKVNWIDRTVKYFWIALFKN